MTINLTAIIVAVITTIFGTAVGYWLKYKAGSRKQYGDEFDRIVRAWQSDNERLRKREQELEKRVEEMERRVNDLSNKLQLMESAHQDLPLPQWLKDKDGTMLALNNAYEQVFLIPNNMERDDYVGRTDKEIWGKEIGAEYQYYDKRALSTRRPVHSIETVKMGDRTTKWQVYKYPRYAGNALIGVGGLAIQEIAIKEGEDGKVSEV
jgi:hypothetical protein